MEIVLGVDVKAAGEYNITFSEFDGFTNGNRLYFHDKQAGISIPVSSGVPYTFSSPGEASIQNRFYLSLTGETTSVNAPQLYPNPVRDFMVIHVPANGSAKVTMSDASGNIVQEGVVSGSHRVDMRNYPGGLYIVKMQTTQGLVVKKILKY
jgi:hypothetical protein